MSNKETKYYSVVDIVPAQAKGADPSKLCQCDKCKETFKPTEVLMEIADNIQFAGIMGVNSVTKDNHTYYLVCPKCHETHLYGFDMVEK